VRMTVKLGFSRATAGPFWRTLLGSLWRNPRSIRYTGALMALYVHFGPFSQYIAKRIRAGIAHEQRRAPAGDVVPHLARAR